MYRVLALEFILIYFTVLGFSQRDSKDKPRPFTQIKIEDYFTLDNKEFVCMSFLQYGEVIIGDTLDVYTTQGLMGKCRVIELENPYTEEKLSIKHAPASLKIIAKALNCSIDERCYLVTRNKLPYGVKVKVPPKKPQQDTLKKTIDTLKKS